jgi:amino acid adenylation domain-containing protein
MRESSTMEFDLDPKQRALFEKLLRNEKLASSSRSVIGRRRDASDRAPLSFAQERLWFLDQLEPNSAVYNTPMALRLEGTLDAQVMLDALKEIVRRHESLRTRFEAVAGKPVQVIEAVFLLEMPLVDLSCVPEGQREAEAMRLWRQEAQRPFDLKHDLMVRVRLFRLAATDHLLSLTVHHIAWDSWSVGVMFSELKTLYTAFLQGRPSPLPELPIQYADFAVWQRDWLQGEVLEKQLSYWREQLAGAPLQLDMPTDRPRPAIQSFRGALMWRKLPKRLAAALKELGQTEDATLFMILAAAFQTLLYRYSGVNEVLLGLAIAGRNRAEVEGLIGFFVNTLVIRGVLSDNPSFRTLLGRTRASALGAYAHQDLPFERLVEELQPQREMSSAPIFQVMLVLQNIPVESAALPGLRVVPAVVDTETSKFDMTVYFRECEGSLRTAVEYSTDLFDTQTIERMMSHYQTLLESVVANPDQRLSELPLLSPGERHQLLVEWNQTEVAYPKDRCLHELIEEQVERTPDATAVVFENEQLTYRELNERANQLGRHLQGLGVGPDTLVGLCVERSLEMVVGLLGILKAGGAYVPLDPEYPRERLAFMLEDADVPVLLTQARLAASLPTHNARIIRLDEDWPVIAAESPARVRSPVEAEHLAYMIYTSGSTGRPKGAMNTHVGIVNRLLWMQDAYGLTPSDRVLQKTPFSFDVSVWEFFWPLLTGARLVVALPGGHKDSAYLAKLICQERITTLHFVPSMLSAFLEQGGLESSCASLKRVICSGEALPLELQQRFFSLLRAELHNLYGPTEAAVDVTYWACERDSGLRTVPIGRPIANTQVYILDRHLQPAPFGVPGELHIGGIGLARGYHNRPDLTAEKFIAKPFGSELGARLYKTGDLARYLANGAIEYLGRLDHQVKIRGFRIELGEIESVLAGHPAVREAAVVAREDIPGEKRLVAYLTAKEREAPKVQELRVLLGAKLPEYMVPSAFVTLEQFPLTPNGKVDRKRLPVPELEHFGSEQCYIAPSTPTEEAIARIWRDLLGLEQVGVRDNFFELGGHSLLAVRLQFRMEKELGRRLPLAAFFRAPTLEELATLVKDGSASDEASHVFGPQSQGGRPPMFCFHFLSSAQRLAKHLAPNRPVYGIESPFYDELRFWHEHRRLGITVADVAGRCLEQVRQVQPHGPYYLAGFCFGGVLAFEVASELARLGEEVPLLALLDAFYSPGCKPKSVPWLRRWIYHARRASAGRLTYLSSKVQSRLSLTRRRRSQLRTMRTQERGPGDAESERLRLPQAEFLRQILRSYRGRRYAGNTVLIRSIGNPFFGFDPGATNGWKDVIEGDLQVEDVGCGHMEFAEEPHITEVARLLGQYLANVDVNPGGDRRALPTLQPVSSNGTGHGARAACSGGP